MDKEFLRRISEAGKQALRQAWTQHFEKSPDEPDPDVGETVAQAAIEALTVSDLKALLAEREPGLCVVPREPSGKMLEGAYDAPLGRARGVVLDWVETEGMVDDDLPVLTSHVDKSFDHLMATAYKAMLAAAEGEG